jgi:hypothetical protein
MSNGQQQRAQIDRETVRALLLANGGGAVAMLAVLPLVLDRPSFDPLAYAMFLGVFVLTLGVALAIAHGYLGRRCALVHDPRDLSPPKGKLFGLSLPAPAVCIASALCMWLSLLAFVGTGGYVAWTGVATLGEVGQKGTPRPAAGEPKAKTKTR